MALNNICRNTHCALVKAGAWAEMHLNPTSTAGDFVDSALLHQANWRTDFHTYLSMGVMRKEWLGVPISFHGGHRLVFFLNNRVLYFPWVEKWIINNYLWSYRCPSSSQFTDAFSGESCVSPKSGLMAHGFQNTRRQQHESRGSGIWCHVKKELLSKDRKEQDTRVMTECIAAWS